LEIDNGASERANRDIALGRGNWTFFGSDTGGKTAAVLRSFIASCKRCGVAGGHSLSPPKFEFR
jgi:transposase